MQLYVGRDAEKSNAYLASYLPGNKQKYCALCDINILRWIIHAQQSDSSCWSLLIRNYVNRDHLVNHIYLVDLLVGIAVG